MPPFYFGKTAHRNIYLRSSPSSRPSTKLIWRRSWETRRQAETAIFQYINRPMSHAVGLQHREEKSPFAFKRKVAQTNTRSGTKPRQDQCKGSCRIHGGVGRRHGAFGVLITTHRKLATAQRRAMATRFFSRKTGAASDVFFRPDACGDFQGRQRDTPGFRSSSACGKPEERCQQPNGAIRMA